MQHSNHAVKYSLLQRRKFISALEVRLSATFSYVISLKQSDFTAYIYYIYIYTITIYIHISFIYEHENHTDVHN